MHVIVGLDVGGAERFLSRLVGAHVNSMCFEHHVVSLSTKGEIGEYLARQGIEVTALGLRNIFFTPYIFFKLLRLIRLSNPDVVQCWMYYADLLGGVAAKVLGTKKIFWGVRNSQFDSGGSIFKRVVRFICASLSAYIPTRIICVADSALNVHVRVGYKREKMIVIPNGYDIEEFKYDHLARKQIREELGIGSCDVVVGSVGRYCPAKDHIGFVRAMGSVAQQDPRVRIMLIGRNVEAANVVLFEEIVKTGAENQFILLGACSNIAAYMSAMDIFCLHSLTEGFPNVLGEAMSVGLPCITTNVGDAKILLGEAGIVVPAADVQALSAATLALLKADKNCWSELCLLSKERIERNYTLEMIIEKYELLYREGC